MEYQDFDVYDFVEKLFNLPPHDPFTFDFEMLDSNANEFLKYFLKKGLEKLFNNKNILTLTENEIETINKYFYSIGYKVIYDYSYIDTENFKQVVDTMSSNNENVNYIIKNDSETNNNNLIVNLNFSKLQNKSHLEDIKTEFII